MECACVCVYIPFLACILNLKTFSPSVLVGFPSSLLTGLQADEMPANLSAAIFPPFPES